MSENKRWSNQGSIADQAKWDWKTCVQCKLTASSVTGDPPRCSDPQTCVAVIQGASLGGKSWVLPEVTPAAATNGVAKNGVHK